MESLFGHYLRRSQAAVRLTGGLSLQHGQIAVNDVMAKSRQLWAVSFGSKLLTSKERSSPVNVLTFLATALPRQY